MLWKAAVTLGSFHFNNPETLRKGQDEYPKHDEEVPQVDDNLDDHHDQEAQVLEDSDQKQDFDEAKQVSEYVENLAKVSNLIMVVVLEDSHRIESDIPEFEVVPHIEEVLIARLPQLLHLVEEKEALDAQSDCLPSEVKGVLLSFVYVGDEYLVDIHVKVY